MRAADAGRCFEKVKFTVFARANEFAVRNAIAQIESREDFFIQPAQRAIDIGAALDQAGREDAARMRDVERWRAVGVGYGETHFALEPDGIDMTNVARNEALEDEIRLFIAERVDVVPDILRIVILANSERAREEAWLQNPR